MYTVRYAENKFAIVTAMCSASRCLVVRVCDCADKRLVVYGSAGKRAVSFNDDRICSRDPLGTLF
jgi:hypothetical protein